MTAFSGLLKFHRNAAGFDSDSLAVNVRSMSSTDAKWIWHAGECTPNTWLRCRHTFTLNALPSRAMTRIAVDSKYWLWVNGTLVVREGGLKRGPTPRDTYVDELDLAPHLRAGENTLALLVWYWGVDGSSHLSSGQGGLMLSADLDGRAIGTGKHWRVSRHPAFLPSTIKPYNGKVILSEWDVHFDARLDEPAWMESDYDDREWPPAEEKGTPPCEPWGGLVDRPIPFWRDSALHEYPSFDLDSASTADHSVDRTIRAALPANLQVYPYFRITAPDGLKITVHIERDWKTTEYITRDGEQAFEIPAWGNGHFVTYTFPPGVQVLDLRYRETGYDTDFAGEFDCDDEALNLLWKKSARSTYLCMRDNYMDCPDRERSQWPNDAMPMMEQTFYAFDRRADALSRKMFREFIDWRTPDGILWGAVPTGRWRGTFREHAAISLATIVGLWEYYWNTGDTETIAYAFPHVRDYLLNHWHVDPIELVQHRGPAKVEWGSGTQNWYDWGDNQDWRLMDNAWLKLALEAAGYMGASLEQDTKVLTARARAIQSGFDRIFWRGEHYASPDHAGTPDERGNALAIHAGLADRDKWPALLTLFRAEPRASIYMEKFVIVALVRMGHVDDAVARIKKRYAAEIASDYSTLPESFGERSNHGWGGWPLTMIGQHIAGIGPLEPGGTFLVRPNLGTLRRFKIVVPSASGKISLSVTAEENLYAIDLEVPRGTSAALKIRRDIFARWSRAIDHIEISGQPVYTNGQLSDRWLSFNRQAVFSLHFPLESGVWRIEARS